MTNNIAGEPRFEDLVKERAELTERLDALRRRATPVVAGELHKVERRLNEVECWLSGMRVASSSVRTVG